MVTAVIVQARVKSTRLPRKVLQDLAGRPVLAHVLSRCAAIPGVDAVVCAVPDDDASRPLETIAEACGAGVFRGNEHDVLERYVGAARSVGARIVMRVTSDCPLIDPAVCGAVLALREQRSADYATNNMPRTFPYGLDCEAFTISALERAVKGAETNADREHVTPWMRRAREILRANLQCPIPDVAEHRWTLDYPEDLAFFRALMAAMPSTSRVDDFVMSDLLATLAVRPDIAAINAACGHAHALHVRTWT